VYTRRFTQLFTVPVAGGEPTKLPIPNAAKATYSADGKKIVYHRWPTPLLGDNERGEVWVANADGSAAVQLTPGDAHACNNT